MFTPKSASLCVSFFVFLLEAQLTKENPIFEQNETDEDVCGVVNVEYQVDRLLEEARSKLDDPMDLPDKNGLLNLVGGQLWGLSTLNRSGTVIVSCNASILTLEIPLSSAKPLRARYEWDKKVLSRTEKGVANARVSNLEAVVTLQVPRPYTPSREALDPRVTQLEITWMEDVEVNISGLEHFSWLWSRSIEFMSKIFQKALVLSIQDRFRLALIDVLVRAATLEPGL